MKVVNAGEVYVAQLHHVNVAIQQERRGQVTVNIVKEALNDLKQEGYYPDLPTSSSF